MTDTPSFDQVLRQALSGLDNKDVRIFLDYFEDLKREVRRHLTRRTAEMPGDSGIAQSALLSMLCDLAVQQIPLSDVDEHGYPMLWPLLLKYVERHCDKWKKYYTTVGRRGTVVSLGFDPADYRAPDQDESDWLAALERLYAQLSEEERIVVDGRLKDQTLEEIAARVGCCEAKVSYILKRIRKLLEDRDDE